MINNKLILNAAQVGLSEEHKRRGRYNINAVGEELVAEAYDSTKDYKANDVVFHDHGLFKCKSDDSTHQWNDSNWESIKVTDFSGTLVLEPEVADYGTIISAVDSGMSVVIQGSTNHPCPVQCQVGNIDKSHNKITFIGFDITTLPRYITSYNYSVTKDGGSTAWTSSTTRIITSGELNELIANDFSSTVASYPVNSYCMYQGDLYVCKVAITSAGPWTGNTNWIKVNLLTPFSGSNPGLVPASDQSKANHVLTGAGTWIPQSDIKTDLSQIVTETYNPAHTYDKDSYVIYDSKLWRCTANNITGEWAGSPTWSQALLVSNFTGATAQASGAPGLVPAPSAGSVFRFLAADGTWKEIDLSGEVSNLDLGHLVVALFSNQETYSVGEYCIYNKVLYKCTTAVQTAGDWTGSTNWTEISILEVIDERILAIDLSPYLTETDLGNVVATIWNKATANTVGQYVIHERKLYRCTSNTTAGADWTGNSNWAEVKLTNLVSSSAPGLMPTLSGNVNDVMRGDGTYGPVASISYDSVNQEVTISFNTPST